MENKVAEICAAVPEADLDRIGRDAPSGEELPAEFVEEEGHGVLHGGSSRRLLLVFAAEDSRSDHDNNKNAQSENGGLAGGGAGGACPRIRARTHAARTGARGAGEARRRGRRGKIVFYSISMLYINMYW